MDDITIKYLFVALAKAGICFDDYVLCKFKEEIVRKETENSLELVHQNENR
ncbi:MAG: hypothetical protein KBT35_08920 [Firmicutes bacterium]|nr:hypothetical protein [Candidatus Colivicinus equi]